MKQTGLGALIILFAGATSVAALTITDNQTYEGRSHFVVSTERATYWFDKAGGGFSRIIDNQNHDWINWNTACGDNAASQYRGLPNFVYGGADNGVGHPGFNQCQSVQQGDNAIQVRSNSGTYEYTWVFTETHATVTMEKCGNYWFLYEGPPAGNYNPASNYWGTDAGLRPNTSGLTGNWRWAYFGDSGVNRVLFVRQHSEDTYGDTGSWMNGCNSSGMVVFGFGREGLNGVMNSVGNKFSIGFLEQKVIDQDSHNQVGAMIQAVTDEVPWTHLSSTTGDLDAPNTGNQQTASLILDIDRDGVNDFVITERTKAPAVVWYRRGATGWTRYILDDTKLAIEAGGTVHDIDGDGDLDVVFGGDTGSNAIWWWENPYPNYDPATPWTRRLVKSSGSNRHHDQQFGDVDGDGQMELVSWNQGGSALLLIEIPADPRNAAGEWPRTTIASVTGSYEGMAIADIDLDGKLDIVGAGRWYKHSTGTTFTSNLIANRVFNRTAVGQLIPGGRPEVVLVPGDDDGPLTWYEWDGSAWVAHELMANVIHGHSLAVADLDGDGQQDIFVGEMGNPGAGANCKAWVLYGDGAGDFTTQLVSTGIANHESKVGDLDGDGDRDILTKPYNYGAPRVDVWLNDGTKLSLDKWQRHVVDNARPARAIFITGGDLDGDGKKDIVTGGWWYKNPGAPGGTWTRNTIGAPLNNLATIYDFDGDGDLDVLGTEGVGSASNHDFVWARNNGAGAFTILDNINTGGSGDFLQGVAVAHYTNNGLLEVALSWHNGGGGVQMLTVPANPSSDTWPWRVLSTTTQSEQLSAGDLDQDTDVDLMLGTKWLRNDSTTWTPFTLYSTGDEADRNRLGDINGDGRVDVVVGFEAISTAGKLAWYERPADPTGAWTEHIISSTVVGPMSLDVADMDLDGDLDVVVGEHNLSSPASAKLYVFENADGQGGSWVPHLVYTGDEHHVGAQVMDIDGDGDLDILSIGWGHNRVLLYENKARSVEVPFRQVTIDAGFNGDCKSVGDLDGDGQVDVVIGGSQLIWYKYPTWSKTTIAAAGTEFTTDMQVGDVDGDGDLDVIVPDGNSGDNVLWFENPRPAGDPAATTWTRHAIGAQGGWAHDIEVGDLNGDTKLDVVVRTADGPTAVYFQTSPTSWSKTTITMAGNGEGTALADLDGDGDLDIVQDGYWLENPKPTGDPTNGATWTKWTINATWPNRVGVTVADINQDGRRDVLLAKSEAAGRMVWYEAPVDPKTGAWTEHEIDGSVDYVHTFKTADINKDGNLDIVFAEMAQSSRKRVGFYLDSGDHLNWTLQVVATNGSHNIRVADIGNDGDTDIVGANWQGPPVEFWENLLNVPTDSTPPTAPIGLSATPVSQTQINLAWTAASDPESGVASYRIYRNSVQVGSSTGTSFNNTGLTEGTVYTYEVAAVNGAGLQGTKSSPVTTNTFADTTAPTIASVNASGDPTKVRVVFSEPVELVSAQTVANYGIDHGITVSAAVLGGDNKTVTLTTATLSEGVLYTLTVNNVRDRAATPNTIATDSQAVFNYLISARVTDGLVVLYDFKEGSGATVNDVSGVGTPLNLSILDTNKIQWLTGGTNGVQLTATGSAVKSPGAATKIHAALTNSSRVTLEAWITPGNLTQAGPARIVTVSDGTAQSQVNLHLGQGGASGNGDYGSFRLRTANNSFSWLQVPGVFTSTTAPRHVVATYDGATQRLYVDGVVQATTLALTGNFSTWNAAYPLALGNEATLDRSWLGKIHLVAIYDRVLSAPEIEQNFGAGPAGSVSSPYQTWRAGKFSAMELADATFSCDTCDPDFDGIPNLLEYALNLEPKLANPTGLPAPVPEGDYLTLTYTKFKAATDIACGVVASDDVAGGWSADDVTEIVIGDDGVTQTNKATDGIRISEATQRFLRLRVQRY
jgi:hypothetical protein